MSQRWVLLENGQSKRFSGNACFEIVSNLKWVQPIKPLIFSERLREAQEIVVMDGSTRA